MRDAAEGFGIWRRTWKRALVLGFLIWLPWHLCTVAMIFGVYRQAAPPPIGGWVFLTIPFAHFADQLLARPMLRAVRAQAMGVRPSAIREPGGLLWLLLSDLLVTALLVGTTFLIIVPALLLVPLVYLTTMVASSERRAPPSAFLRSWRLSRQFRWDIFQTACLLWAIRWVVTLAILYGGEAGGLLSMQIALAAGTLVNVILSGLFASVQVAFYQRIHAHHDDTAGALGKIFE